jgi:hypothetical protein
MERNRHPPRLLPANVARPARAGLLLLGLLSGCYPWQTVIDGQTPPVAGTLTRQLLDSQAAKAEADDFVIYKYEWLKDGPLPGPFGSYHLNEIAKRLPTVPFPVVIEPTIDGKLNEARRQFVVEYLARHGMADADHRVVISFPAAEGLYAECEGERTFNLMLLPQAYRLRFFGLGGYGYGGFGGFGFGGGSVYGGFYRGF